MAEGYHRRKGKNYFRMGKSPTRPMVKSGRAVDDWADCAVGIKQPWATKCRFLIPRWPITFSAVMTANPITRILICSTGTIGCNA